MPEAICLGCGTLVDAAAGTCPACGLPVMKREARLRLGLGGAEPGPGPSAMPAEVEEAAREPANSFAGKYILVRKIGGGGMAWVWKAWEIPLARCVAIKFLKAPSGEDVLRFEREARLAASLNHPNIVPVFEFGRSRGEYYLVMKFVDGAPLHVARPGGAELLKVMGPVCDAVHHAHESGVIHRDLKPQNIMLTADGWPYVLDFGLAKQVEGGGELSVSGFVMGTPQYMAPEQAAGRRDRIDRRSDVYGLGATLYTLVAGRPPFVAENALDTLRKVLDDDLVPPRRLKPETPAPLEAIILKAMEKDPERRYPTAAELAEDLRRLASGKTIVARAPRRRWVPRFVRQNPAVSAGAAALLLTAAAAILWLATQPPVIEPARPPWLLEFVNARAGFETPGGDVPEPGRAALESVMKRSSRAPSSELAEAAKWYLERAQGGGTLVEGWERKGRSAWFGAREEAARLREWSRAMQSVLRDLPGELSEVRGRFGDLETRAAVVAEFPGLVTLQIDIRPYALVRTLRTGDRWLVREGKVEDPRLGTPSGLQTPCVLAGLELASYEIELVHPGIKARTVPLPREEMRPGEAYLLQGKLEEGGTLKLVRAR